MSNIAKHDPSVKPKYTPDLPPEGQTARSQALSLRKKMLDMSDGDEHFVSNLNVGPINDMYLAIRMYSLFPQGAGLVSLISDTQINRR